MKNFRFWKWTSGHNHQNSSTKVKRAFLFNCHFPDCKLAVNQKDQTAQNPKHLEYGEDYSVLSNDIQDALTFDQHIYFNSFDVPDVDQLGDGNCKGN